MSKDTPIIALAGREWPVPRLGVRQNRIVVPALLELVPKIIAAREAAHRAGDRGIARLARILDTASYDRLAELVHAALTRAHPDLSRAAFDDMEIDTLELIGAIGVIASQAGFVPRDFA